MDKPFLEVPQFKESRLPSLYSDFDHLKEINPEGFAANQDAWKAVMLASLRVHTFLSSIALPGAQLAHKLLHPIFGEPKLLGPILDLQIKSGDVVPWSIYKDHNVKSLQGATSYFNPKKVANALWSNLKLNLYALIDNNKVTLDYFIVWSQLVLVGEEVYAKLINKVNADHRLSAKLFDEQSFSVVIRSLHSNLSDVDIKALLVYFSRDTNRIAITNDLEHANTYIKVGSTQQITEDEIRIIKLLENIQNVQKQIDGFDHKLNNDIPETIRHLMKSNATEDRLKNVLIRKSAYKKSLSKASGVFSQLTLILDKIDDAKSNIELFDTLKGSKAALALLNEQVSLSEIDELNADLNDELALSNDISDALLVSSGVDEDEINKELEDLEKESKKQGELDVAPKENASEEQLMERLQNLKLDLGNEPQKENTKKTENPPAEPSRFAETA